jgi:hypothetical protein
LNDWARYYLDTGPLLDHLLLRYFSRVQHCAVTDVRLDEPISSKVCYLKNSQQRLAYAKLTRRHRLLATTPGVVVEIYRHICEIRSLDLRLFWRGVEEEFTAMGLSEVFVAFEDLTAAGLAARGPVDQALVILARRERAHCIVTGERKLRGWCRENEVPCVDVDELIELMATRL